MNSNGRFKRLFGGYEVFRIIHFIAFLFNTVCIIENGYAVLGMEGLWLENLRASPKRGPVLWKNADSLAPNL